MCLVVVFLVINTLSCSLAAQTPRADDESTLTSMLSESKRIIGGKTAVAHSYPFLVGLEALGDHFCGGSIVAPQWILTAAHCFAPEGIMIDQLLMPYLEVVVGDHSKVRNHTNELRVRPDNIVIHPDYSPRGKDSDVALLRLSTPLIYNEHVLPIKLAKSDPELNRKCVVAGWGVTNVMKKNISSEILKFVSVSVLERELCRKLHKDYKPLNDNMFCAGNLEGGRDTCVGDSGGPLFCTETTDKIPFYTQYGVTSWGPKICAKKNTVGVYARLSKFIPWIESVTGVRL